MTWRNRATELIQSTLYKKKSNKQKVPEKYVLVGVQC